MKVAFYKGDGDKWRYRVVDGAIRWWTEGPYSHTEIVFSDGSWFSISPRNTKVRLERVAFDPEKWDFIEVALTPEQERTTRSWAELQVGKRYDWLGIFLSQILPLTVHDLSRWFCSEIVLAALQQVGLFHIWRPNEVHPNMLAYILRGNAAKPNTLVVGWSW
jgi:hypothetical protein